MRYYDELLDDELPRMYDLVEATRKHRPLPGARRFADLARRLYTIVAEVTELTEKADNALQVTEDVYLARVYTAALELFRVPAVSAAVDRKLSIIRDTYSALYDEAHASRSELLEIIILMLIALEIVLAFIR
jgi:Holliday junction resolvasome RuvABC endonuclease subunit